jgi:hypothetical protein
VPGPARVQMPVGVLGDGGRGRCGTGGSRYLNPAPFAAQGLEVQFFTPPARLATLPPEADTVSAYRTRMPAEYGYRGIYLKRHQCHCYVNVT